MRSLTFVTLFLLGTGCASPVVFTETEPASESVAVSETLTIVGLNFEIPTPWFVVSSEDSTAVIRTETDPYNVDVVMKIQDAEGVEPFDGLVAQTSVTKIYDVACGGAFDCYSMIVDDQSYSIFWQIESTQTPPENLDGIWIPDHQVSREQLLEILKTVTLDE